MPYRIETGRLDRAERAAGGGLRVPAAIGRAGILVYRRQDGSEWREYRPPEEAFATDSLASLRGAPVTDLHPTAPVTPASYRSVARGHVGDDPRQDDDHIAASLYVADADLQRAVEAGERAEVSAGYTTDLEAVPGVTTDGQRYDAVQRNVRYNHVALGPRGWGRAGPTVALRLDGDLDAVLDDASAPATDAGPARSERMKTERIDGVDYEVGTDTWAQARARHDAATAERLTALEASVATLTQERDEAMGRADGLEAKVKETTDPATITAAVKARVELERRAAALRADLHCDGLSDRAVMLGALKLDDSEDLTDGYLRGRFDALVEASGRADESLRETRIVGEHADGGAVIGDMERAQEQMIHRHRDGWKREA